MASLSGIAERRGEALHLRWQPPRRAFSLLELLLVLAIILILSVLLYGSGSRSYQQKQMKACGKNLLKIHIALQIYANDHEEAFPSLLTAKTSEEPLALLVPRYTADTSPFICPGSGDSPLASGESFVQHKISYAYLMGQRMTNSQELLMTDRQVDSQPKSAGQILFSTTGKPPGNNHDKFGGNCLFVDGHVELSSAHASLPVDCPSGVVLLNPKP